jgi:hypothetical protein
MPGSRGRTKSNFNDRLEEAKITLAEAHRRKYSPNPEMARYQQHMMDTSYLDKQHMKKVMENRIKLKEQQLKIRMKDQEMALKIRMKDQEMATMIIQVAGLQSDLRVKTMAVRNIKAQIMNQRHYLHDIIEETKSLRSDNVNMNRAVQELENLKKVNKELKGRAHKLNGFYEKRKDLVKQIKEAERKNKMLNEMVQASILQKQKEKEALAARKSQEIFPSSRSQAKNPNTAGSKATMEASEFYSPERSSATNQLNPNAVTFQQGKKISVAEKTQTDDGSLQKIELCVNEMKRKFAEALLVDEGGQIREIQKDSAWTVEVGFIYGSFRDGTFGVKVELKVVIELKNDTLPAEEVVFPPNSSSVSPAQDLAPIYWQWLAQNKRSEELTSSKVNQVRKMTRDSGIKDHRPQTAPNANLNGPAELNEDQRKLRKPSTNNDCKSVSPTKENLSDSKAGSWKGSIKRDPPSVCPDDVKATSIYKTETSAIKDREFHGAPNKPDAKYTRKSTCTSGNEQVDGMVPEVRERVFQHQQLTKKISQSPKQIESKSEQGPSISTKSNPTRSNPNPNYRTGPRAINSVARVHE